MEEKINSILRSYTNCFKDLDCSPLMPGEFVISFDMDNNKLFGSLINMDRKIYKQSKILKELTILFPENKENLEELRHRLWDVREQIFKVLKEDFNICSKFIDKKTDQIEYVGL